jgi:5-formyltetrahydrofolate cyclo-ligase
MDVRQSLRKKLKEQRAKLSVHDQTLASKKITEQLSQNILFQQSSTIAGYIATQREINPALLLKKALDKHKGCYLPILQENRLIFSAYDTNTLFNNNAFNIPEPLFSKESLIEPCDLDLVLVPLLGFTTEGQRLGMGGGFYDRSFSFLLTKTRPSKPYLLGLAYEWQKLATFAACSWDVPLNAIITEKKVYLCQ